ncbi:hypothetical protein SDC9_205897 [bioreactor metagenome]|uniref:Uncharacterized protein n=1 Tax=bioreactor metagenome TaxID=1076179 RepID=A0A645J424_9ZZZZ
MPARRPGQACPMRAGLTMGAGAMMPTWMSASPCMPCRPWSLTNLRPRAQAAAMSARPRMPPPWSAQPRAICGLAWFSSCCRARPWWPWRGSWRCSRSCWGVKAICGDCAWSPARSIRLAHVIVCVLRWKQPVMRDNCRLSRGP